MSFNFRDNQIVLHIAGGVDLSLEIAREDNTGAPYSYYGYLSTEGFWVVQRREANGNAAEYKYAAGKTAATMIAAFNATTKLYTGSLTFRDLNVMLTAANLQ